MRRLVPPVPHSSSCVRLLSGIVVATVVALASLQAQQAQQVPQPIPGRNVNVMSGLSLPDGDPYLQRQNEPSVAASTRNPMHLLGGSNDYRTVDIPGLECAKVDTTTGECLDPETRDAWVGLFKSVDGGQRWKSTLHPGFQQDNSQAGLASPLKAYQAGADAVVRAGTHGMIYYSGLVFDRAEQGKSAVFLSRFIDNNNQEAGDPFAFLGTTLVATAPAGSVFLDKPWMAVDIPRANAAMCSVSTSNTVSTVQPGKPGKKPLAAGKKGSPSNPQQVPAGAVYVSYTAFSGEGAARGAQIWISRSMDCGKTWGEPIRVSRAEDQFNQGSNIAIDPRNGNVYVAYRRFDPNYNDSNDLDAMMVARIPFNNKKADPAGIVKKFPKPKASGKFDPTRISEHRGKDKKEAKAKVNGSDKGKGTEVEDELEQFDLDDRDTYSFRSLAYPTMAIDGTGRVYIAWTQRGFASDPVLVNSTLNSNVGARIVMTTTLDGKTFQPLQVVDDHTVPGRGHQLMPAMSFAGGKLMLIFYDMRETRAVNQSGIGVHTSKASDIDKVVRHTIDIRSVTANPADRPVFSKSERVSDYLMGVHPRTRQIEQLQVNPPNLPMFKKGTVPFMGDYIDVAAAPAFIPQPDGKWIYNVNDTGVTPVFHAVWTDNRDVRPPTAKKLVNGKMVPDWTKYTPAKVTANEPPRISLLDGSIVPECKDDASNAGTRNQNVYSSRITTNGLIAGSPGNAKPLSTTLQRGFSVFATNTTDQMKSYRMTILSQPPGGRASFDQFPLPPYTAASPLPETAIEMIVPARSTAARTVYITSTDPDARVNVDVSELVDLTKLPLAAYPTAPELPGGAGTTVFINPDMENPDMENPDMENPDMENPDIMAAEVYNPDMENPDMENPDMENPDMENPDMENPDMENPDMENPDMENPDIQNVRVANPDMENPDMENPDMENPDMENPDMENPDMENPDMENHALTDIAWKVSNTGNTTASFNVNLFLAQQQLPLGVKTQLILLKTYRTPVTVPNGCQLGFQVRNILLANIPNPQLVMADGEVSDPNDPRPTNATLWLAPGEEGRIVLRILDETPLEDRVVIPKLDSDGNPVLDEDGNPKFVSLPQGLTPSENITSVVQQQSVNTEEAEQGVVEPPLVPSFPAPQAVTDVTSTAELTPVTINVLANDSTAFGSTKVISLHPAGMAAHSGGVSGDITYQPATGYLYTQRGIVDPTTNALVGRLGTPSPTQFVQYQKANPRTGINYQRTSGPANAVLSALDARPDSTTFHQYMTMPALADSVLAFDLDTVNGKLYVLHSESIPTTTSRSWFSAIDIDPARATFHQVLFTIALPAGVRGNAVGINTRTQKVFLGITGNGAGGGQGGVYVVDATVSGPDATRIPNTFGNFGVAVNESSNQVFSASSYSTQLFQLNVIDGASLAVATIQTSESMRFSNHDERLVVHDASTKVFMRLGSSVVVIDAKRGSPTRNTVLAVIPVGLDQNNADIAIDQQLGRVITTGQFDYRADIIDVATHSLFRTVPLPIGGTDVAVDPVRHVGFVSTLLTSVIEVDLFGNGPATIIPVFVESGGPIVNPVTNRTYVTGTSDVSGIGVVSGAGPLGAIAGITPFGRYVASARHLATNRFFFTNTGNQGGTSSGPGTVAVVDGATDTVIKQLQTLPVPFGIGIDQAAAKIYVASVSGDGTHGGVRIFNANDLDAPGVDATFTTTTTGASGAFPLNSSTSLVSFSRFVVPNPNDSRVYLMQSGGSPTSVAVLDPNTNVITPLDGGPGTPLYDYQQAQGETWGRAHIIRVNAALNRIIIGFNNGATNRGVVLDGTTLQVVANTIGGGQSGKHTANYIALDEAMQRLFVADYAANKVYMLDAATMATLQEVTVPAGPDALALNLTTHRLYVSSIDSKMLSALDYTPGSLTMSSSVHLPLVAYAMVVDEVESRVYTSGGDSADESGVMVVTDILGQLGTNVSVTGVGNAANGIVTLNDDYSVTYTPNHGFSGTDTFTYNIAAPTGTAIGTVTINVAPSNPTSVSFGDAYATSYNTPLGVNAPGPLANDAAGDGPAVMVVDQQPTNGQLSPAADGSFVYTPNTNFSGTDSFTYHTTSDLGSSNESTVTITVSQPNELVVTTTADSGTGSLRNAILIANTEPNSIIKFDIPGAGPHVIQPVNSLPVLTAPVVIDGYTQPGASPNTSTVSDNAVIKIVLNGASTGVGANGLFLQGGNSTVRGLAIGGFPGNGIQMDTLGNNIIEGNFIGTNAAGTAASPNAQAGIASQSPNNQIGTMSQAGRNVISGNGNGGIRVSQRNSGTTIQSNGAGTIIVNNFIGVAASGVTAIANSAAGIFVNAPNVTIGGSFAFSARNVISGNGGAGISSSAATTGNPQVAYNFPTNLVVQGNWIGLRADGGGALANSGGGLNITGANSLIGGVSSIPGKCTGPCNVVSGNSGTGINITNQYDNPPSTPTPTMGTIYSQATGTQVLGNFVGLHPSGGTAIPNGNGINVNAPNVTIGNAAPGGRNYVAGNSQTGISLGSSTLTLTNAVVASATGSVVRGNYVGLDATGNALLTNSQSGINSMAPGVTIGGPGVGDGNYAVGALSSTAINISRQFQGPTTINAADNNIVQGNVVGVFANGGRSNARGTGIGISTSNNQVVGNTVAGLGNGSAPFAASISISGNSGTANGNTLKGNLIGTDASGAAGLGNFGAGFTIFSSSNNTIGGTTAADRNIVVRLTDFGLYLSGGTTVPSNNNVVIGNYFGVLADGQTAAGNTGGIQISTVGSAVASGNVIGGSTPGERNIIASTGLGNGITLFGAGTTNTVIRGNYLGVAADGTTARGNAGGVMIQDASGTSVGGPAAADGNLIANNTGPGVTVTNLSGNAVRNSILNNRIFGNTGQGIDLGANGVTNNDAGDGDTGPNNLQNFPVLSGATNGGGNTTINADISTFAAGNTYAVQFFASASCAIRQGGRFIGSANVVQPGATNIVLNEAVPDTDFITATATDSNGNTSEFSACVQMQGPTVVTTLSDSGAGSLRDAINYVNANAGGQTITFNVAGVSSASPGTINLASALPTITVPVTIDGMTQPGYSVPYPAIELNGTGAANANGLTIQSSGVTVRALTISRFPLNGIAVTANNFVVTGSNIGVRPDGVTAAANGLDGVSITGASNTVGGALHLRNLISGNGRDGVRIANSSGTGNVVLGNFIGVSVHGTGALPNARNGVTLEQSNSVTVGGSAMNIISGNGQHGVHVNVCDPGLTCNGHLIEGNRIGTNAAGTAAVANAQFGVRIENAPLNTVRNNLISGNTLDGVSLYSNGTDAGNSLLVGNLIGTDDGGGQALPNQRNGVALIGPTRSRIGGTAPGERNVISGNAGVGVSLENTTDARVEGNYIGMSANGSGVVANQLQGVLIYSNTSAVTIGGSSPNAGNVISSNGSQGIYVGNGSHDNLIRNNLIGWDVAGTISRGNTASGVHIDGNNNTVEDNRIANNGETGIRVSTGTGNRISRNRITQNSTVGIQLGAGFVANDAGDPDSGANNLQNFPVLSSVSSNGSDTTVVGTLNSTPNSSFTMEFFETQAADPSGFGEGARYLAMLPANTDSNGNFNFSAPMAGITTTPGWFVTATATDAAGNTSSFSQARQVDTNLVVVSGADSGSGTLRAAISNANATLGVQTITFNIPGAGPKFIQLATSLPPITDSVVVDATTQPSYAGSPVITIGSQIGGSNIAFSINANNVVIRGFSIIMFADGIMAAAGFGGHTIENNIFGTGVAVANARGISWRANTSTIRNNVVSANGEGLVISHGATGNQIEANKIGVGTDGILARPNGTGVSMYEGATDNVFADNIIAANSGWGVNIQNVGAPVSGTRFHSNKIGVNGAGNVAGNLAGGLRLENAQNTIVGEPGLGNTISGNGGTTPSASGVGILVLATTAGPVPNIRSNYIGLDPTGVFARPNNDQGLALEGPAMVGGLNVNDRNYISGNGLGGNGDGAGILVGVNGGGSVFQGNIIGLNVNNDAAGNGYAGIDVRATSPFTIGGGGGNPGARNVIAGNGVYGISVARMSGAEPIPWGTIIQNNVIGTDATETLARPNGSAGIFAAGNNLLIGGTGASEGNVIANNGAQGGIRVDSNVTAVRIQRNAIYANTGLGIDLDGNGVSANDAGDGDSGANNVQNFPVLSNVSNDSGNTQVSYSTNGFAAGQYTLDFYSTNVCDAGGHGEGATWLGSRTVNNGANDFVVFGQMVPGGYFITATATDTLNLNTSEFSACVQVPITYFVTNTNTSGPGSLTDAMSQSNATPGEQQIRFAIPGAGPSTPAVIALTAPLPIITDRVFLNAESQAGWDGKPIVEVSGQGTIARGFETATDVSNVRIRGFALTRFTDAGIYLAQTDSGGGGHAVISNYIGTNRNNTPGIGNVTGIRTRSDWGGIIANVISGNTGAGLVLENDADNVTIQQNTIGLAGDQLTTLSNGTGIVIYGSENNTIIDNNFISGNIGWGIDLQATADQVSGTQIRRNTIGLDKDGNDAGNGINNPPGGGGGIRINGGPGTVIGGQPAYRNIISGNGGPNPNQIGLGILIQGTASPVPTIRGNYIGLDPTGVFARGNWNKGIHLNSPALIGGSNLNDRNYIAGNGDVGGGAGVIADITSGGAVIHGNVIGLNVNGDAVPNGYSGVTVFATSAVSIGGGNAGEGNVISGNGVYGISVIKAGANPMPSGAVIGGNLIGTAADGTTSRPNGGGGVFVFGQNIIIGGFGGLSNTIAHNSGNGITLQDESTAGVRIDNNAIHHNSGLGIDLGNNGVSANDPGDGDTGPNGLLNYPEFSGTTNNTYNGNTFVTLDSNSLPAGGNLVNFFKSQTCDASGFGEGEQVVIRFGITGQLGPISLDLNQVIPVGWFVTATVSNNTTGNSSEFSLCAQVPNPPPAGPTINSVEPSATFASGQALTLLGSNFQAAGGGSVIIRSGGTDYPGTFLFSNDGSTLTVRTGAGAPSGTAQLIAKNGAVESAPFAINIQSQVAAPLFKHMYSGGCGAYGGPGDTTQKWSGGDLLLVAAGIDTTGNRVLFTPNGGGPEYEAKVLATCIIQGYVALHVQIPALPLDDYNVTIRSSSGGTESVNSNSKPIAIQSLYVNGVSGGAACTGCPGGPGQFLPQYPGTIQAGQRFTITASGVMNNGGSLTGPEGSGVCSQCLDSSNPRGALLGRFPGSSVWFLVSSGGSYLNGGVTGYLELAVNDSDYSDNGGGFDVIIWPETTGQNVTVPGQSGGSYPPAAVTSLNPNQQVTIFAEGLVIYDGTNGSNPDGGGGADLSYLAPGLAAYSLIARIGGGPWQAVGSGPTTLTASSEGGLLELAVNDSFYGDNSGTFAVVVRPQ